MTETIKQIVLRDNEGYVIGIWDNMSKAAEALGVSRECIRLTLNGRTKRSVKIKGKLSVEYAELHIPTPADKFDELEGEEWRVSPSFPDYEVSSHGRIRKGYELKRFNSNTSGYCHTTLLLGGEPHSVYVHRLVAEAFLPTWDPALVVNHKDENKANNHISNLEMMTQSENVRYSYELHKDTWGPRKNKKDN